MNCKFPTTIIDNFLKNKTRFLEANGADFDKKYTVGNDYNYKSSYIRQRILRQFVEFGIDKDRIDIGALDLVEALKLYNKMDKVEDLIAIQNVDDILSVMANTPIVDDSCFFFLAGNNSSPIDIKLLKKTSASDTDVLLSTFLIEKEYKKYNAGLAIKMWINWDEIPLSMLSEIDKISQDRIDELKTNENNQYVINHVEGLIHHSRELTDEDRLSAAIALKEQLETRLNIFLDDYKYVMDDYKALKDKREGRLIILRPSEREIQLKQRIEELKQRIEDTKTAIDAITGYDQLMELIKYIYVWEKIEKLI